MNGKKSLLEKYSISIEHLDFEYIKSCSNVRELEKMIEILKSGEEGFYPDLTRFAETKLNEIDPENRMLRTQEPCMQTSAHEKQEISSFLADIKSKENQIRVQSHSVGSNASTLPPVRVSSNPPRIDQCIADKKPERIAASDYKQWDKFDADTECLKIDLHEERMCERGLAEQKRQQKQNLIEVLPEQIAVEKMSDVEKQVLADKHRIKGNEFFRCAEFQQAIAEYTTSLTYAKIAASFNNRALVYLKQKKYDEAIRDCDDCLKIESTNVKAMLRKCEALVAIDRKNEAYTQYTHILQIDPGNDNAKKALKEISLRLSIQDVNTETPVKKPPTSEFLEFDEENDFHKKLVIPIRT